MAPSPTLLSCFPLLLLILLSLTSSSPPHADAAALVLPVSKHPTSLQYTTTIIHRTPPVSLKVVLDLSGSFLWLTCGPNYNSSTYHSPQCHSPLCPLLQKPCNNNTCILLSRNVFTSRVSKMELSEDVLALNSTSNGLYPTSTASVPQFPFFCAPEFLSDGLAGGATGVAGLGYGPLGLPYLLNNAFNLNKKFAICLSPLRNGVGVLFFGDGPYWFLPGIDVSKLLISTPLIMRPKVTKVVDLQSSRGKAESPLDLGQRSLFPSYNYYIRVKSMRVNGEQVPLNSSLLAKISTASPYTIMRSSVYTSVTKIFIEAALASNATRVAPKGPFSVCFATNGGLPMPAMPAIDLVLQSEQVFWRILESNSMVSMGNGTSCLGFLNGGVNMGSSITIGGYQLEDNLLQFDLKSSMLGFTNTLLFRETNCASFNYTSGV